MAFIKNARWSGSTSRAGSRYANLYLLLVYLNRYAVLQRVYEVQLRQNYRSIPMRDLQPRRKRRVETGESRLQTLTSKRLILAKVCQLELFSMCTGSNECCRLRSAKEIMDFRTYAISALQTERQFMKAKNHIFWGEDLSISVPKTQKIIARVEPKPGDSLNSLIGNVKCSRPCKQIGSDRSNKLNTKSLQYLAKSYKLKRTSPQCDAVKPLLGFCVGTEIQVLPDTVEAGDGQTVLHEAEGVPCELATEHVDWYPSVF